MRSVSSPRAVSIRIGHVGAGADAAADLEPVHVRQHHVEQHGLEAAAAEEPQPALRVGGDRDLEARGRQVLGHHRGQAAVVLDHQDALGHAGW